MRAKGVVVADTTPLNYLAWIGHADILGAFFEQVLVPDAVMAELRYSKAPEAVSNWLQSAPAWLRVTPVQQVDASIELGRGETEAISLAIERNLPVILMDERRGRAAAEARGLLVVGILNILDIADELGKLDGIAALETLRHTNFRAEAALLDKFRLRMRTRRR